MKRKYEDCCSVCLDEIDDSELATLECKHALHINCYESIISSGGRKCPICRDEIDTTDFFKLMCQKIEECDDKICEHHKKVVKAKQQMIEFQNVVKIFGDDDVKELCSIELTEKINTKHNISIELHRSYLQHEKQLLEERIKYKKSINDICEEDDLHEWISMEVKENMSDYCEVEDGCFDVCKYCDAFANSRTDKLYYELFTVYGRY